MANRPDEAPRETNSDTGGGTIGAAPGDADRRAAPPTKPGPPTWVAMSGLGFEFVAAVLLPGALGWWIDRMAGTSPWLMLVGGMIGFAIGLRLLMKTVNRPPAK